MRDFALGTGAFSRCSCRYSSSFTRLQYVYGAEVCYRRPPLPRKPSVLRRRAPSGGRRQNSNFNRGKTAKAVADNGHGWIALPPSIDDITCSSTFSREHDASTRRYRQACPVASCLTCSSLNVSRFIVSATVPVSTSYIVKTGGRPRTNSIWGRKAQPGRGADFRATQSSATTYSTRMHTERPLLPCSATLFFRLQNKKSTDRTNRPCCLSLGSTVV